MENCSFCGKPVCEDPAICEQAAEYEARLVAASVPTITIPVAEYERLKRRANRFSLNALLVVLNVYENHLIDRYGWGDYPAEETTLVDNFRAAIKEQEG